MLPQAVIDSFAKLDVATNEVADEMAKIRAEVKVGMSQESVDAVVGHSTALETRLRGLSKNPDAPVPQEPTPQFSRGRR